MNAIADTVDVAGRNLRTLFRTPQALIFATIQPVIFVLLFRYAFGGAIRVPGTDYVDYLMPGIFAQVVVFGSLATAVGLATDLQSGLMERFRSLPMARSAVLLGRTLADLVRNVFVVTLMCLVGLLVGWSPSGDLVSIVAGLGLVLGFAYVIVNTLVEIGQALADPRLRLA